jgi:hypothetical protein
MNMALYQCIACGRDFWTWKEYHEHKCGGFPNPDVSGIGKGVDSAREHAKKTRL